MQSVSKAAGMTESERTCVGSSPPHVSKHNTICVESRAGTRKIRYKFGERDAAKKPNGGR